MKKKVVLIISSVLIIIIAIVVAIVLISKKSGNTEVTNEKGEVLSSTYITIDDIFINDSYVNKNNPDVKEVCLFYTLSTQDKNLSASSASIHIKINDMNDYSSYDGFNMLDATESSLTPNFYYSRYVENINVGSSKKFLATFKIPEGDLQGGKSIKLMDNNIPDIDKISFSTDFIKHAINYDEIAKTVDLDGYNKEMDLRSPADEKTINEVNKQLSDAYVTFFANNIYYRMEFGTSNDFTITAGSLSNNGIYIIKKGYLALSYDNGATIKVYVPYEFNQSGELTIHPETAFDVNQ